MNPGSSLQASRGVPTRARGTLEGGDTDGAKSGRPAQALARLQRLQREGDLSRTKTGSRAAGGIADEAKDEARGGVPLCPGPAQTAVINCGKFRNLRRWRPIGPQDPTSPNFPFTLSKLPLHICLDAESAPLGRAESQPLELGLNLSRAEPWRRHSDPG
eukprot:gene23673-biopygen5845